MAIKNPRKNHQKRNLGYSDPLSDLIIIFIYDFVHF